MGRQVGRLSSRQQLERLSLADPRKDPKGRSRWPASVAASTKETEYFALFMQNSDDARQVQLQQVSLLCAALKLTPQQAAELFGALLLLSPLSTTMQTPSLDLRHLVPTPADLADTVSSASSTAPHASLPRTSATSPAEDDDEEGDAVFQSTVNTPRIELMPQWRSVLRESIEAQGYVVGEAWPTTDQSDR